jgi:hypothetical protein
MWQLQTSANSNFNNILYDSCTANRTCAGSTTSDTLLVSSSSLIKYGTAYYWRVRVGDGTVSNPDWSSWANYSGAYTYAWAHPAPLVSYTPSSIHASTGSPVTFTDNSTCYDINGNSYSCYCNPSANPVCNTLDLSLAANNTYKWWFKNADNVSPDNTTKGNPPPQTYSTVGAYTTKLQVCDGPTSAYCCSATQNLSVATHSVPQWWEISPF